MFIENSRVSKSEIRGNVYFNGRKLPKRYIFTELKKYVGDFLKGRTLEPRMVGIAGIRGVGKTTLLWQIADFVKKNFRGVDAYFLSMDIAVSYGFDGKVLIEALKKIIPSNRKTVLLFDEVQYLDGWNVMLKIVYDVFKNAFIIATGSSSLLIRSNVDLSTRWNVESLYPLSFTEFVMIGSWLKSDGENVLFPEKEISLEMKDAIFLSESVQDAAEKLLKLKPKIEEYFEKIEGSIMVKNWKNYLKEYIFYRNIPRLLLIDEERVIINRTFDLIQRILYQDLREFYEQNEVEKIRKFLILLAFSDEISIEKTSRILGIGENKVERIVESLVKSELLIKFPTYGGVKTRMKSEKVFFVSPTMRFAIINQLYPKAERYHSKLYEDIVAMYLKRIFNGFVLYGGRKDGKFPDFVIEVGDRVIPLEVGTGKRDLSQIDSIEEKKYGLLVNVKSDDFRIKRNNLIIPLRWFLLM